jgi:hypothetical protein
VGGGGGGRSLTLTGHPAEPTEGGAPVRLVRLLRGRDALCYRYDEAETMVQDQYLVPADLRDIGRDVPSRPATVLGSRQGATEQQQQ